MVVLKVKPVESCGNGGESLECTRGIATKPFATRNKPAPDFATRRNKPTSDFATRNKPNVEIRNEATRNKPTPDSRLVASQRPHVEREEAPKPSFHELNTPHRSQENPLFLSDTFSTVLVYHTHVCQRHLKKVFNLSFFLFKLSHYIPEIAILKK